MKQLTKTLAFYSLLTTCLVNAAFVFAIVPGFWHRRRILSYLIHYYSRVAIKILGIDIKKIQNTALPQNGSLFVSNHLSYLDVVILASQFPCAFVTSQEVKNVIGLGQIVTLAGCLFVERRSKENLEQEILQITKALGHTINVVIFPEATSTNGESVLRFRRPLFQSAILAKKPIQPCCLNYLKLDDASFSIKNRDDICWYGDMTFIDHLWRFMSFSKVEVTLTLLEVIDTTRFSSTEILSTMSHEMIRSQFRPVVDLSRTEKILPCV